MDTSRRSGSLINRHAGCRLCFQAFCLPRRRLVPPLGGCAAAVWVGFCQWDERGKASPPDESCFLRRTVAASVNDPTVLPHMHLFVHFSQVPPLPFRSAPGTAHWHRRCSATAPPTLCRSAALLMVHVGRRGILAWQNHLFTDQWSMPH